MNNTYNTKQRGQVVMITTVMFLVISLAVLAGVVMPTSNQIRSVSEQSRAKQGYLAADSVNEEAFYRLNHGYAVNSVSLPFSNNVSASAQVTDVNSTTKQITTTGTDGETTRSAKSVFSEGEGYSFNYGLQLGNGGITMSNSATINGNVYANGNISGANSAQITGSATAAAVSNTVPEITNGTSTPTSGIDIGRTGTALTEVAQSFVMSTSTPVLRLSVNLKKAGSPTNLTMRIMTNSSGSPSNTQKGPDIIIPASSVGSSFGWIDVYPSSQISLTSGSTYWLKLVSAGTSASNYYSIATTTNAYSSGLIKTKAGSGSWTAFSPSSQDEYFEIYTGNASSISGMTIGGSANAFSVTGSSVTGNLYCQTGSSNNKSCNTSQALPSTLAFGVTSSNIDDWITDASSGQTLNSSLNLSNHEATTTSGALKINGSLNLSNDAVMTLGGPLYVTGSINLANNAIIRLASSFGSGDSFVVFGDGVGSDAVNTSGSGQFKGSGTSGSYIVVASKAGDFNIANSGGSVVIITLSGTANFSNSATAKSVTAYRMTMANTSSLNYESGLADINFTTGPSGSWSVDSWSEVSQ